VMEKLWLAKAGDAAPSQVRSQGGWW
jgi:hypothetical protein